MDKSQTEPAKQEGAKAAIVSLIIAGAAVAAAFGLDLSKEQLGAIVVFVGACFAAAPYVTALRIRERVFAPATVKELVTDAHQAGAVGAPAPKVTT